MQALRKIQDGWTQADMIQDLRHLAALGEKYPDLLAAINFDSVLLEQCSARADGLGTLYGNAFVCDGMLWAFEEREGRWEAVTICWLCDCP